MIRLFRLMFGTVIAALGCGAFWHNKPARWHGDEKGDDLEQAVEFEGLLPKRKTRDPVKRANHNNPKCDEQPAGNRTH